MEKTLEGEYIMANELILAAECFFKNFARATGLKDKFFNIEFESVRDHPDKLLQPILSSPETLMLEKIPVEHKIAESKEKYVIKPIVFVQKSFATTKKQTMINHPNGIIW